MTSALILPNGADPNLQTWLRSPRGLPRLTGEFETTYRLDTTEVDVDLARKLYYNRDQRYKLGAAFARPIVDVPAGFMRLPMLTTVDPADTEQQKIVGRFVRTNAGKIIQSHMMVGRDGRVLVRLQPLNRSPAYKKIYGSGEKDLEVVLVPTEAFDVISADEDIGAIEAVRITHSFMRKKEGAENGLEEAKIYETISANTITFEYPDDDREPTQVINPLGFVPAVELQNEGEVGQLRASSSLEPVEPYMKFYHDVMLHAGAASQLHSTAKLIVRAQNLEKFLENNFSTTEMTNNTLRFKNRDVLFFESGTPDVFASGGSNYAEGADIIQAKAPLGETTTLLEFIFRNIVDASEIPEWAFGGAMSASKASVTEQSSPIYHLVKRKRAAVENQWVLLGRMAAQTIAKKNVPLDVDWSEIGMRDLKTEGEAIRNFAEAVSALNEGQLVSKHSGVEVIRKLAPEILPYDDDDSRDERTRIEREIDDAMAQATAFMDAQGPQLEEDDRETGRSASGRSSGTGDG